MKLTRFICLVSALAVAALVCGCKAQQPQKGEIDDAVAKAKKSGVASIVVSPPWGIPRHIDSLDEETQYGYILHVHALSSVSALSPGRNSISTWYKFSVLHDLSKKSRVYAQNEEQAKKEIPGALLPVRENEIVICETGGQISLDGVKVTYGSANKLFTPGNDYIVIVEPGGTSGRLFALAAGGEVAYSVSSDGDTLVPLRKQQNTLIQDDIKRRFNNSLVAISHEREANK